MNFTVYSCDLSVPFLNRDFYRDCRYEINPVKFTVKVQGTSDSQGYPVNFTGKLFAVQLSRLAS